MVDPTARRNARMARMARMAALGDEPQATQDDDAQDDAPKAQAKPKKDTPGRTTPRKTTTAKPAVSRGSRPGGPPPGTDWLPTYMPRELYADMRDAYMWQLDHTDDPDTSLARWLSRAVIEHCNRTPQERAALAEARPEAQVKGTAGNVIRSYTATKEALAALDPAEVSDRAAGLSIHRTAQVTTAVWAAVEATRALAGGHLMHYEGRLPSKPNPARRQEKR